MIDISNWTDKAKNDVCSMAAHALDILIAAGEQHRGVRYYHERLLVARKMLPYSRTIPYRYEHRLCLTDGAFGEFGSRSVTLTIEIGGDVAYRNDIWPLVISDPLIEWSSFGASPDEAVGFGRLMHEAATISTVVHAALLPLAAYVNTQHTAIFDDEKVAASVEDERRRFLLHRTDADSAACDFFEALLPAFGTRLRASISRKLDTRERKWVEQLSGSLLDVVHTRGKPTTMNLTPDGILHVEAVRAHAADCAERKAARAVVGQQIKEDMRHDR